MSTHRVEVIRIKEIERHSNADSLGLVRIEGFTAIVRLGDFQPGDLAVYIEPDYVVPDNEQFAFLAGKTRIRAKRLRGVWSQGLLIKAPVGAKEGECVMQRLGITRYEPPMLHGGRGASVTYAEAERPHSSLAHLSAYDLENWRKYRRAFTPGERVIVSEKIHGASARFAWRDGRMWVGSRNQWKRSGELSRLHKFLARVRKALVMVLPIIQRWWKPYRQDRTENIWWRVLKTHPWIVDFCKAHPASVLYGEVYGWVQDLRYGASTGEVFFRAFDVMRDGSWVDAAEFITLLPPEHRVPVLYDGDYNAALMEDLSRGDSTIAQHLSEGIVIKPASERSDPDLQRVALKLVSDRYLERAA